MNERDLGEKVLNIKNNSIDLVITRSHESNVSDEDFKIIEDVVSSIELLTGDIIDLSTYKSKKCVINIDEKRIIAGLPGVKITIGNYIEEE